jgi:hypothetical protein
MRKKGGVVIRFLFAFCIASLARFPVGCQRYKSVQQARTAATCSFDKRYFLIYAKPPLKVRGLFRLPTTGLSNVSLRSPDRIRDELSESETRD